MDHQDEIPYKPPDVTKRKVLLKLELTGNVPKKLESIATTVYGLDNFLPTEQAEDSSQWKTTDHVLYADAKKSYDEMMAVFRSKPKVYKFESTKNKIWERNETGGGLEPPQEIVLIEDASSTAKSNKDYFAARRKKRTAEPAVKVPLTEEQQAATYINPFQTVLIPTVDGNDKEKVEVWHEKLEKLKQLTPREDLEGYELREDYSLQQKRLCVMADFQQHMREEIYRREELPTEIEQVEDVLYDIVDAIARNLESIEKSIRIVEKQKVRSVWHPASVGFKMRPLGATVSESGEVTIQVSDFLFNDFMISPISSMLAVRAPPELFELHEQERRIELEKELRRLEEEELEKKRPLTQKLRIAVAMARHDPAAAAKKAAADVLDRAIAWPRSVSERLMQQGSKAIARGLAGLMHASADPHATLEDLSDTIVQSYRNVMKRVATTRPASPVRKRPKSAGESNQSGPSIRDVERIIDLEERNAREREELQAALHRANMGIVGDRPMVPVQHADAVQITLTMLCSPPAAYTMRPPPSWRRDLVKAKKKVMGELRRRGEQAAVAMQRIEESDTMFMLKNLTTRKQGETHHHPGTPSGISTRVVMNGGFDENSQITGISPGGDGGNVQSSVATGEDQDSTGLEGPGTNSGAQRNIRPSLLNGTPGRGILKTARRAPPRLPSVSLLRYGKPLRGDEQEMVGSGEDSEESEESDHGYLSPNDPADRPPGAADTGLAGADGLDPSADPEDGMFTARSRRHSRMSQSSRRSGLSQGSQATVPTDYPLDHEDVYIERIRNKRTFSGNILPKDMIPKAFRKYRGKLVFDVSERRDFETGLVSELADAVSLPVRNISIEQIRRLEIDSPKLYALQQLKDAMILKHRQDKQEEEERRQALLNAKKAYHIALEKEEGLPADSALLRYDEALPPAKLTSPVLAALLDNHIDDVPTPVQDQMLLLEQGHSQTESVCGSEGNVDSTRRSDASSSCEEGREGECPESATLTIPMSVEGEGGNTLELPSPNPAIVTVAEGDGEQVSATSLPMPADDLPADNHSSPPPSGSAAAADDVLFPVDASVAELTLSVDSDKRSECVEDLQITATALSTVSPPPTITPALDNSSSTIERSKQRRSVTFGEDVVFSFHTHSHPDNSSSSSSSSNSSSTVVDGVAVDVMLETAEMTVEAQHRLPTEIVDTMEESTICDVAAAVAAELGVVSTEQKDRADELTSLEVTVDAGEGGDEIVEDQDQVVASPRFLHLSVNDSSNGTTMEDKETGTMIVFNTTTEQDHEEMESVEELEGEQHITPDPLHILKSQPLSPVPFKIGVLNPDEMRRDPDYWLSKRLADLSAEERRQYRIRRLRLLRKEDELTRRMRELRQRKEELIEDAVDLFAPVIEKLQPFVNVMRPVVVEGNRKLLYLAERSFQVLNDMTKNYRGPRMLDLARFDSVMRSVTTSAKLLREVSTKMSESLQSGKLNPASHLLLGAQQASQLVWPQEILDTMEDMLEELEHREVEDEVMLVLRDLCKTVDGRAVRGVVASVLDDMCALVENHHETADSLAKSVGGNTTSVPPPRSKALVPLEEAAPSDYDFDALVKHLNIDLDGHVATGKAGSGATADRAKSKTTDVVQEGVEEAEEGEGSDEEDVESALLDSDNEKEVEGSEEYADEEVEGSEEDAEEEVEGSEEDAEEEKKGSVASSDRNTNAAPVSTMPPRTEGEDNNSGSGDSEEEEGSEGQDEEEEEEEEEGSEEQQEEGSEEQEEEEEEEEGSEEQEEEEGGEQMDLEGQLRSRSRKLEAVNADVERTQVELDEVTGAIRTMDASLPNGESEEVQTEETQRYAEVGGLLQDMCDRVEVMVLLDELCTAVVATEEDRGDCSESPSLFHGLSEIEASGVSVGASTVAEKDLTERLVGCEVTFMVFVSDEQRQLEGLADIEAEDIAVMIQEQLYDAESPLSIGKYTGTVLDVRYKIAHKRQQFAKWESFYAHIIHPTFFGYSAKLPQAHAWASKVGADGLINGRLPSGVAPLNPTLLFNERNKGTFQEITGKPILRPPGERVKMEDDSENEDEGTVASAMQSATQEENTLDLNVDEFAQDVKRLKLYRPNMSALTTRDVQRLKRLAKAFEENYEEQMRKGLVDGKRLRPQQYQAMKDRDSAYRIYRTARQKLKQMTKGQTDELVLPPLEVTKIDHDTFEGWVEEVRQEDQRRLRDARSLAAKRKKILQQEALLRRGASKKRFWIIDTFVGACDNPLDVGHAFEEEMLKLELQREFVRQKEEEGQSAVGVGDTASEKLLHDLQDKQKEFKKLVISEEKKTRRLFELVGRWAMRTHASCAPTAVSTPAPSSPSRGFFPEAVTTDTPLSAILEDVQPEETDVVTGSDAVTADVLTVEVVTEAAATTSSTQQEAVTQVVVSDTQHSETTDSPLTIPSAEGGAPSTGDKVVVSEVSLDAEEAPSLKKTYLHEFLSIALQAIATEEKRVRREQRRVAREARTTEKQRRRESLQAFHGKASGGALSVEVQESDEEVSTEEEDALFSPGPLSPSPLPTSTTQSSTVSFPLAELNPEEFELVQQIGWVRAIRSYPQFLKCLQELPTLDEAAFARDELIQFAGVVCEIEPVLCKVLAELAAAKEATEVAMGLRKSKSMEAALQAKQRRADKEEKRKQRKQTKKAAIAQHAVDIALAEEEAEKALAERLLIEQQKALEALGRAAEREKAWFMAHPHKFIRHAGQPAFCIVCMEKENEYWMKSMKEDELQWRQGFDVHLQEAVDQKEQSYRETVQEELSVTLSQQAAVLVAEEEALEERQKAEDSNPLKKISKSFRNLKLSPLKLMHAATQRGDGGSHGPSNPVSGALGSADEDEQAWPRELSRITQVIRSTGLCLVDARGRTILPKRPPKKVAVQMHVAPVLVEESGTGGDAETQERLGLRIRVWHRDAEGNRANFLGCVSFNEQEIMKPPKGMRTFTLQCDPAVVESEPTPISGNLVVMLRATHKENKDGSSSSFWRLEIIRAGKLASIADSQTNPHAKRDLTGGGRKPPNSFCEIYWKGPGVRNKQAEDIVEWTLVGHTATKQNTENPQYDKETDTSLLELPPVWTDLDIPRSQYDQHFQEGGGWVARNQVPSADEAGEDGADQGGPQRAAGEKRFPFGAKSEEEVLQFRRVMKYNDLVSREVQARLEALRYLFHAEERERKYMAHEERQQRSTALTTEIERSRVLVERQTEHSRSFMRLLHLVRAPPNILARLRFLMGEDSSGGSQKVMCEDPATGRVFHVVSTPILRRQDEEFMLEQMNELFGISCGNLVRMVDFSVHQLRDFNDKGFSSIDERVAIAVLDYIEGCTVMEFLNKNWESVSNDTFRDLLCQIMNALRALHEAGIVHRNVHPGAIVLELPNSRNYIKKRTNVTKPAASDTQQQKNRGRSAKPLSQLLCCRLGDYWFLHNPRSVGCESSVGRADWGSTMTTPPEAVQRQYGGSNLTVLRSASASAVPGQGPTQGSRIAAAVARRSIASGGSGTSIEHTTTATDVGSVAGRLQPLQPLLSQPTSPVTDRSDIYAFGVCVYYWATHGLYKTLPLGPGGLVDLAAVKTNLPLKWKPWLHSLFDMCLQVRPENRASAKDIHLFLSSRFGK